MHRFYQDMGRNIWDKPRDMSAWAARWTPCRTSSFRFSAFVLVIPLTQATHTYVYYDTAYDSE